MGGRLLRVHRVLDLTLIDTTVTIGNDINPWWLTDTTVPATHALPYPSFNAATNAFDPALFYDPLKYADPLYAAGTAFGDIDDVLMFTARSTGKPFVGRIQAASSAAGRPAWPWNRTTPSSFIGPSGRMRTTTRKSTWEKMTYCRIFRWSRPDLTIPLTSLPNQANPDVLTSADLSTFLNDNDLSVHPIATTLANGDPAVVLVTNSLQDLAKCENRVAHLPNIAVAAGSPIKFGHPPTHFPLSQFFPNHFQRAWLPLHIPGTQREGEDIVQTDLLAFDVRAYDPTAELRQFGTAASPIGDLLSPGDWGWDVAVPAAATPGAMVGQARTST